MEQLDHKKDGLHDILKKFEELLQTEELKLLKSSEIFKEESSKLLPVSINQLQFNQKSRELKTTANKNLTIYLTERFFFSKIYQDYPETVKNKDYILIYTLSYAKRTYNLYQKDSRYIVLLSICNGKKKKMMKK